ncbi:MAG: site-specific integrase [Oricola sp.]
MTRIPGLSYPSWPVEDRRLFEAAFQEGDIFDAGPLAHLSPVTKREWMYLYGRWLGYAQALGLDVLALAPGERISEHVEDFLDNLLDYCAETTVATAAHRLFMIIRALCPREDWSWLKRIAKQIGVDAVSIPRPQVLSLDLYRVGFNAMDRAEEKAWEAGYLTKSAAILFRDGLMVATLVEAPMRRSPFTLLEIGEHLQKQGAHWVISVPAELTKTDVAQEYELSERLSDKMDIFLERIRPAFPGAANHDRLWPESGGPIKDYVIRDRIMRLTENELGYPVTPHRFRNAVATFVSIADPANVRVSKDLLGHASFATTERHYIDPAQSRMAGQQLQSVLATIAEAGR